MVTGRALPFCGCRTVMKALPPPPVLVRQWLESPHTFTAGFFAVATIFAGIAVWLVLRNLRHNEPGLTALAALFLALLIRTAQFLAACCGDGCRPLISGRSPFL